MCPTACTTDAGCNGGQVCCNGTCQASCQKTCASDADCPTNEGESCCFNQVLNSPWLYFMEAPATPCTSQHDCAPIANAFCDDGPDFEACAVAPCKTYSDCDPDYSNAACDSSTGFCEVTACNSDSDCEAPDEFCNTINGYCGNVADQYECTNMPCNDATPCPCADVCDYDEGMCY
jgi:hypothetical protein